VSCPKRWPDLTVIPWREEEMVLAVPPSHRFAGRGVVDVRELDGEKFVSYDADLSIRKALDRALRHYEVAFSVALEFDNIENIKRAVEISAGVAILPEPTLTREVEAGTLVALRLIGQDPDQRLTRPLAVIHRRQQQLGLTAARFLKLLTEEGGGMIPSVPSPEAVGAAGDGRSPAKC
jgi:DNA-binding transcriptional LysR family regulator